MAVDTMETEFRKRYKMQHNSSNDGASLRHALLQAARKPVKVLRGAIELQSARNIGFRAFQDFAAAVGMDDEKRLKSPDVAYSRRVGRQGAAYMPDRNLTLIPRDLLRSDEGRLAVKHESAHAWQRQFSRRALFTGTDDFIHQVGLEGEAEYIAIYRHHLNRHKNKTAMLIYDLAYYWKGEGMAYEVARAIGKWQRNGSAEPLDRLIDNAAAEWRNGRNSEVYRVGTALFIVALAAGADPEALYRAALSSKAGNILNSFVVDTRGLDYYDVAETIRRSVDSAIGHGR